MTSNLGSSYLLDGIDNDGEITEEAKEEVNLLLKKSFRPEFLNRLDEIIFFKPLTFDNMLSIVDLILKGLSERLNEKQLSFSITDTAKRKLVATAYDPQFGARPLKRYVQSQIETLIAKTILAGDVEPGDKLEVDVNDNNQFVINILKQ